MFCLFANASTIKITKKETKIIRVFSRSNMNYRSFSRDACMKIYIRLVYYSLSCSFFCIFLPSKCHGQRNMPDFLVSAGARGKDGAEEKVWGW